MQYATAATLKGNAICRGKRVSLVSVQTFCSNAFGHCTLADLDIMNRLLRDKQFKEFEIENLRISIRL